jgi:hypothetical protein
MVADDIMKLNKKYIDHEKSMEGSGLSGGFLGALAGMILPQIIGSVAGKLFGNGMSGGAGCAECPDDVADCVCGDANKEELEGRGYGSTGGFAEGTMMDTGFDRTIGAGMSAGVKKYKKRKSTAGCGCSGGGISGGFFGNMREMMAQNKIKPGNPEGINQLTGIKNMIDSAMKKGGRKSKKSATELFLDDVDTYSKRIELDSKAIANDASLIKGKTATERNYLKSIGAESSKTKKPRKMKGAGIISDMGIPLISNIAGMFGLGRSGGGMSGGAELGLPPAMAGEGMAKKGRKSKMGKGMSGGRQLVPVANMKASYMAGLGRSGGGGSGGGGSGGGGSGGGVSGGKASGMKRGDIVKRVMAERGLKMIEASKYVKEHNLY